MAGGGGLEEWTDGCDGQSEPWATHMHNNPPHHDNDPRIPGAATTRLRHSRWCSERRADCGPDDQCRLDGWSAGSPGDWEVVSIAGKPRIAVVTHADRRHS